MNLAVSGFLSALLILTVLCDYNEGTPLAATDSFTPPCGALLPPSAANAWLNWSSPSTWGSSSSPIPGVGSAVGANATIPCGVAVLLDVPAVSLTVLNIKGYLRFLDSPSLPRISLNASLILVQGQLSLGSRLQHFRQQATITLVPNPMNRQSFLFSENAPADASNPRDFGHKALVVVGGQLDLHGMPGGPSSSPTWCQLAATAAAGANKVKVNADVSKWPVGGLIVVATTDYDPKQSETFTIVSISAASDGTSTITLNTTLKYMHYGDPLGVPDGYGGYINECAEVALLSRNILITGLDEPSPNEGDGGHVTVYFTRLPQFVEGVEFSFLGQAGLPDRFPLHFLFHRDQTSGQATSSTCSKNSFHHTKQRCVVLTATNNMTIDNNVAYSHVGHCYALAHGGETGNSFIHNFGALTLRASWSGHDLEISQPTTFFLANPLNHVINNTVAGSMSLGLWYFLEWEIIGLSRNLPELFILIPFHMIFGQMYGNTFHSNWGAGVQILPNGAYPRAIYYRNFSLTQPYSMQWLLPPVPTYFRDNTFYKQNGAAVLLDTADSIFITDSRFADCTWSVYVAQIVNSLVSNSRFVALSNNYGNPDTWNCGPISGCAAAPVVNGVCQGRSTGINTFPYAIIGITIDMRNHTEPGNTAGMISNCMFYNYNSSCGGVAAAIQPGVSIGDYFNANQSVKNMSLLNSNAMFIPSDVNSYPGGVIDDSGELGAFLMMRDMDGSMVGGRGGYVVANRSFLLPPSLPYPTAAASIFPTRAPLNPTCTPKPAWNAYACPQACWRTVGFWYQEPGFTAINNNPPTRPHGSFSYLEIKRVGDNVTFILDGNLNTRFTDAGALPTLRFFYANLFAPATYEVTIKRATIIHTQAEYTANAGRQPLYKSPPGAESFTPPSIDFFFQDGGGCKKAIEIRIVAVGYTGSGSSSSAGPFLYAPTTTNRVIPYPAPGLAVPNSSVVFGYLCSTTGVPALSVVMGGAFSGPRDKVTVNQISDASVATSCSTPFMVSPLRSVIPSSSVWWYEVSGRNLHPKYNGSASFATYKPRIGYWYPGRGPFGFFAGWSNNYLNTHVRRISDSITTYYFRRGFTLYNTSCYSALLLHLVVDDGVVVYLNGKEVYRNNMPDGTITYQTLALTNAPAVSGSSLARTAVTIQLAAPGSSSASAPALLEGYNWLAVEVHPFSVYAWEMAFDARVAAVVRNSSQQCNGQVSRPEICDGLDNDGDGRVDMDASGKLLQIPCFTACGVGFRTCFSGFFGDCSAPKPKVEVCNGIDDDCNGIVDDGFNTTQLNCPDGTVCSGGTCRLLSTTIVTTSQQWGQNASSWLFNDSAIDLSGPFPDWRKGKVSLTSLKSGTATIGYDSYTNATFATTPKKIQGKAMTMYFFKSFSLTADQVSNTFSFTPNVRRDDGAVVYLNGYEIFRTNIKAGAVAFGDLAPEVTQYVPPTKTTYYNCDDCSGTDMRSMLLVGTNWIAVELHQSYLWSGDLAFDLELKRNAIASCPAIPPALQTTISSCARATTRMLLPKGASWKYNDNTRPPPPDTWMMPEFDDSAWPAGISPLGSGGWYDLPTKIQKADNTGSTSANQRWGYYFRTTITLPDGGCFFNFNASVLYSDGFAFWINGIEVMRQKLPPDAGPYTKATGWSNWKHNIIPFSGMWLPAGGQDITVAVQVNVISTENHEVFFDLILTGMREAVTCSA